MRLSEASHTSVTPRALAVVLVVLVILVEIQFASQKASGGEKVKMDANQLQEALKPKLEGKDDPYEANNRLREKDRRETALRLRGLEDDLHLLRNRVKRHALKIKTLYEKLRWERKKGALKMKRKLQARLRRASNKTRK